MDFKGTAVPATPTAAPSEKSLSDALLQVLEESLGFVPAAGRLVGNDELEEAVDADLDAEQSSSDGEDGDADGDDGTVLGMEATHFGRNTLSLRVDARPDDVVARAEIDAFERRLAAAQPGQQPPPAPSVAASRAWSAQADAIAALPPQRRTLPAVRAALRDLTLSHLHIDRLDAGLRRLAHVEELNLCNNAVREICNLPPRLEVLWLAGNQVAEVPESPEIAQLAHLSLAFNRLVRAPAALLFSEQLASLDLSYNRLADLGEMLELLSTLPNLHHCFLAGNPLALEPFYRALVIQGCSEALCILDDLPVLPQERSRVLQAAARLEPRGSVRLAVHVGALQGLFAPDGAPFALSGSVEGSEEEGGGGGGGGGGGWPTSPRALLADGRPLCRAEIEVPAGDVDATECRAWSTRMDFNGELHFELPVCSALRDGIKFGGVKLFLFKTCPAPANSRRTSVTESRASSRAEDHGDAEEEEPQPEPEPEPFDADAVMADSTFVGMARLDLSEFLTPALVVEGGLHQQTVAADVPVELDSAFLTMVATATTTILPEIVLGEGSVADGAEEEAAAAAAVDEESGKKKDKDKGKKKRKKSKAGKKEAPEDSAGGGGALPVVEWAPASSDEQRPVVAMRCVINYRTAAEERLLQEEMEAALAAEEDPEGSPR